MAGGHELTLFCVDVSPSMRDLISVDDPCSGQTKVTKLEYGLEVVKSQVANMLLAALKTVHCGIVLFGSDRTKNSLAKKGYEFIWEYVSPGQPDATTLTHIDGIKLNLTESEAEFKGDLLSAIILCNHLMGETLGSKKWTRKLVIVTDAETQTDWNGWKEQRNKMRADGVIVNVVGLDFDDEELGYAQPHKSEIKAANEKKLDSLCRGLANGSTCSTALLAVMNAQSPQPRVVGAMPSQVTLSLGYPDPETARANGYDPEATLHIVCRLQKCTTVVRPMSAKKMSRLGIPNELDRWRRDMIPPRSGGELEQYLPSHNEEEEEDHLSGLLLTNRKAVYAKKSDKASDNKDEDESDDAGQLESSDGEACPLEPQEIKEAELLKAYKYGASRVLLDKEDEARIRQSFSTSLQIKGFISLDKVPRHHLMNNVYYLFPADNDGRSQITFSALTRAMIEGNRVALTRYVSKAKSAEPKLVILIPVVEPAARYFLFIQVPFAEDLREYFFPPLHSGPSSLGRRVNPLHVPTDEMLEAMDSLVDKMDLSMEESETAVQSPEPETEASGDSDQSMGAREASSQRPTSQDQPWLSLENTCNPAVHHLKNCVLYRLAHPDSKDLPAVHPALSKCLTPPEHVVERAAPSLERVKRLLDIKPIPSLTKKRQKFIPPGLTAVDPDKIDLDEILGDISKESQPSKVTPPAENPAQVVVIKKEPDQDPVPELPNRNPDLSETDDES